MMMKTYYKKICALFVIIAVISTTAPIPVNAYQIPAAVRVGLYYKDSSTNTALSIFDVSAAAGLQIGFSKDNIFVEIYRESSPSALYVRKDAHYYNEGNSLKEYNPEKPSDASAASQMKFGPYHIKIGNDYPDAATAGAQAAAYRQLGIWAYIAYADAWQVWAGSYADGASAQTDLPNLIPKLGEMVYTVISPSANRIVLTNAQYQPICMFGSSLAYLQLRPAPENNPPVLSIRGKLYRGALEVRRLETSDMTVINVVSMREYLYGNVPAEIGGRSPAEAIKAQAIASKMYAINNMGKHGATGFDVCATTSCQVYKGYSSEVPQCNSAIDEVTDKVITYNGELAGHIFYFASSGGRTEDVRNVWGSSYPYLVSVEDKYEKIYTWTKTLRASDVKSKLPQLGNILGITITQTSESGRVTQLAVRGTDRNDPAVYSLEKTRTLFSLDSQLYTIATDADVYTIALAGTPAIPLQASADTAKAVVSGATASAGTNTASAESTTIVDAIKNDGIKIISASGTVSLAASGNTVTLMGSDGKKTLNSPMNSEGLVAVQSTATVGSPVISDSPVTSQITLPYATAPQKTQLGGKKVITASGVSYLNNSNNKMTILGSDGRTKKVPFVPETYTFTGKGWGHAVGMSQEGAIGMGKAGLKYDEILTHYFQGTKIE